VFNAACFSRNLCTSSFISNWLISGIILPMSHGDMGGTEAGPSGLITTDWDKSAASSAGLLALKSVGEMRIVRFVLD